MKIFSIILPIILSIIINGLTFAALSEKEYLNRLNFLAQKGRKEELKKNAKEFFKKFPRSNSIADVRLILADNEPDADKAIRQFRILVDKYRYLLLLGNSIKTN